MWPLIHILKCMSWTDPEIQTKSGHRERIRKSGPNQVPVPGARGSHSGSSNNQAYNLNRPGPSPNDQPQRLPWTLCSQTSLNRSQCHPKFIPSLTRGWHMSKGSLKDLWKYFYFSLVNASFFSNTSIQLFKATIIGHWSLYTGTLKHIFGDLATLFDWRKACVFIDNSGTFKLYLKIKIWKGLFYNNMKIWI